MNRTILREMLLISCYRWHFFQMSYSQIRQWSKHEGSCYPSSLTLFCSFSFITCFIPVTSFRFFGKVKTLETCKEYRNLPEVTQPNIIGPGSKRLMAFSSSAPPSLHFFPEMGFAPPGLFHLPGLAIGRCWLRASFQERLMLKFTRLL